MKQKCAAFLHEPVGGTPRHVCGIFSREKSKISTACVIHQAESGEKTG